MLPVTGVYARYIEAYIKEGYLLIHCLFYCFVYSSEGRTIPGWYEVKTIKC